MRNGVAGFFTHEELDEGKGVIWTEGELKVRAKAMANKKDPTPCMAEFREEFLANATAVLASEAYERYRTLAEAKKPANVLGCGISFVAQDLERQLVCCAIQTLQSKGYEVGTIIHDGFLVRSLRVKDQDLRDAEEAVRRTHGYEVRFVKKSLGDFDESALWDPTDEDEGDADAASHTDLARAFLKWLEDRGHRLVRAEKKMYWYDPEHGVYLESEKLRRVRRYMNACPALPKANRGETGFQSKLIVQIEGLLEDDPDFHDKIIDTTLRKIPFSNGVYCCETQRLVDYDADMYFLEKGSVEYDPQSEALKAEVYQRAFLDVFGTEEIARYVLRSLARAMAGETEDKVFFIVKGRTNSGKGLLTLLISKAFFNKFGTWRRWTAGSARRGTRGSAWPTRRPRRGDAASTATPSRGPRVGTITRRGPTAWTR